MGKHRKPSPSLTNIAIVVVLLGWSANFVTNMISPDYDSNTQLDSMLLAVLGFLLAGRAVGDKGPPDDVGPLDDDEDDGGTERTDGGEKK